MFSLKFAEVLAFCRAVLVLLLLIVLLSAKGEHLLQFDVVKVFLLDCLFDILV